MTGRRLVVSILWASLLGLVVALVQGEDRVVSVQIWLAGFAAWLAALVVYELTRIAPVQKFDLRGLVSLRRADRALPVDRRPQDLRTLESLLIRAQHNPRTHSQQLQPRLRAVACHFLELHHGIDPDATPEAAAQILGEVYWLIDPNVTGAPQLDEVDAFLARVLAADQDTARQRFEDASSVGSGAS